MFSTLLTDNKELHYFPKEKLPMLIKKDNADISIAVMHHSTEWFQWKCKKDLENYLNNYSSILFIGHEHNSSTKDLNINNENNIFISAGGEFAVNDILGKSEFNAIVLDSNTNIIDSYYFEWDSVANIYNHSKLFSNKMLTSNSNKLVPKKIYLDSFKEDEKRKIAKDFTQYFVFPMLVGKKKDRYSEKLELSNIQEFITELFNRKFINIVGGENSGKTVVLKSIYLELISDKVPLFFNLEEFKGKNISKVIKSLFEDQYSDNPIDYERFQQLCKTKKVAIIDDFDMIKNEKFRVEFIELLKEQFEYIIIGTKNFGEYDIINNVRSEIDKKNDFFALKISNFYLTKRLDLIKNVCKLTKQLNEEDINKIVSTINGFVKHQIQLFELDPDFIIQYTQYFVVNSNYESQKSEAIFNKIFETNIYNAIIKHSKKDIVDEILTALEEVAYFMHFNKKYPLSFIDLQSIINNYNERYSENVNAVQLVEIASKAKILKRSEDSFSVKFCNNNHLAFFVAKYLIRKYHFDGSFAEIEYILKNICFGINDNIVLFISYLTDNPNIIMAIYQNAEKLMSEWEELNLDTGNIKFIKKIKETQLVEAPKTNDRERIDELENELEEEVKNDQIIECKNIYDYNENDIDKFPYKILRALKYTEMISKSLPNFHNILLKENKEKLSSGIYKYPNKILFKLLKLIDDNFDDIVNEIKGYADSIKATNKKGVPISKEEIEKLFKSNAISIILGLYNNFAYLATDKKSISILNNFDLCNSNYRVFNLMVAENYGNTEEIAKKAEDIFDNTKDQNVKNMIAQIVRKHLIYTENIKVSKRQQLINKYFGLKEKKSFLIEAYRDKIV